MLRYSFGFAWLLATLFVAPLFAAPGRGGGGRPSFAGAGGGGARPNFGGGGGNVARPPQNFSRPPQNFSRPPQNISRPATPNINRPSVSNMNRPVQPSIQTPNITRPTTPGGGLGQFHPGGGAPTTRPTPTRPTLPPGGNVATRPTVRPPGDLKPIQRPGLPGGGNNIVNRPTLPERPGTFPQRPGTLPERPVTLPGVVDRPPNRPGPGVIDRPSLGQRPTPLPSFPRPLPERPTRPTGPPVIGGGNRPNYPNRPGPSPGWGVRPDRPWDRPGYWHNHDWNDHWHNHYVNNHFHNWYHGCWHGHWGNNWYSPILWAGAGYGVGSWWTYSNWGYGSAYYNPYYVAGSGYDYSQPIIVNQYVADTAVPAALQVEDRPPDENRALALFDEGAALFKDGKYPQAYAKLDAAQKLLPRDPVVHEVKALCLFALGRYKESAAILNALLASSPGMDWTSMSALYGDEADYTAQLRRLETHVKNNPTDAAAIFVLAYQYLVIGENDAAVRMLKAVVQRQPEDLTAKRMLDGLAPATPPVAAETPPATDAADAPSTDLTGEWVAKSEELTVELTVTAEGGFTWKATPKGKPPMTVTGNANASENSLALTSKSEGTMVGQVKSLGPDKFNFLMAGATSGDPGLIFTRR